MIVVDFDGTLLRTDGTLAKDDLECLTDLGRRGTLRVIATGRSAFSYRRAVGDRALPIDFAAFSSGAVVAKMPGFKIVRSHELSPDRSARVADVFLAAGVDFMIQDPMPDNHRFAWHKAVGGADFLRRISLYEGHCRPLTGDPGPSTQLLAVLPSPGAAAVAEALTRDLMAIEGLSVIRATSPLDHESLWLEVFPEGVSKSRACARLAADAGIAPENVLAVGNDYNDHDVLRWAGTAFVTGNAPEELRAEFEVVAANDHGGVAEAVRRWLSDEPSP
jgi:hydroxymethylpyrimidine pyrophosphatase-like HAD family hydrolase